MASSTATNGASTTRPSSAANAQPAPSEFEIRRAELVSDIGESLEQVLQQMNTLNRSLEGIIAIGNEFSSVEALWSQFENVMGREPEDVKSEGDQSRSQSGRQSRAEEDGGENEEREGRRSK